MGYWKTTVVPKFKKLFEKNNVKKAAAAEACKTFDGAKEDYSKDFEEKKSELQAKVIEIYEASSDEIKAVVKEKKEGTLKKVAGVEKFLEELTKIEFPGSKPAHEAYTKFGPTYVEGPVFFVFEKVSTYIVVEEKKEEETPAPEAPAPVEETSSKEKEIVVEEEKKEEVVAEVEKTPEPTPVKAEEVAPTEPPKAC